MCGIAGWFGSTSLDEQRAADLRTKLAEHILVRGHDGTGSYLSQNRKVGFQHARLSIIDPTARAAQPLVDAETGSSITYNGEIYNYQSLRDHLTALKCKFITTSDTEVILLGYLIEGVSFFSRLRGMYAFAIHDALHDRIVLARDHMGIKPLYICQNDGVFFFGSSARGLAKCANLGELDPAAAISFMLLGCVLEPLTAFKAVKMLPPGIAHVWDLRRDTTERHATGPFETATIESSTSYTTARPGADQLEEALRESVIAHFVSDVPVAVFQSAGLDSTLISTLAQRSGLSPTLITLGFGDFRGARLDEGPVSSNIARHLGLKHHLEYVDRSDFVDLLGRYLNDMESPTTDGINNYIVSSICGREGIKVALSGLGADEMFSGYPSFKQIPLAYHWRKLLKIPYFKLFVELYLRYIASGAGKSPKMKYILNYFNSIPDLYLFRRAVYAIEELQEQVPADVIRAGLTEFLAAFHALAAGAESGTQESVRHLERDIYMRNMLLRDADWAGMANGVEIRVPYVDEHLRRQICRSEDECPYTKADLAAVLARIDPTSPALGRKKTGFSVPYQTWFSQAQAPQRERFRTGAFGIRSWAREVYKAQFPDFIGAGARPAPSRAHGAEERSVSAKAYEAEPRGAETFSK